MPKKLRKGLFQEQTDCIGENKNHICSTFHKICSTFVLKTTGETRLLRKIYLQ